MYDLLVALLVWLSASSSEIDTVAPRAATCSNAAYVSMLRETVEDQETEVEPDDTAGGGKPPASVKKRVVRCVNGRCYITYE